MLCSIPQTIWSWFRLSTRSQRVLDTSMPVLVYSKLMKSSTIDVEFFLYRISVNNVGDQTSTIPPSLLLSDYIL